MDVIRVQVGAAPAILVRVQVAKTGEQINVLVQDTTEAIVILDATEE